MSRVGKYPVPVPAGVHPVEPGLPGSRAGGGRPLGFGLRGHRSPFGLVIALLGLAVATFGGGVALQRAGQQLFDLACVGGTDRVPDVRGRVSGVGRAVTLIRYVVALVGCGVTAVSDSCSIVHDYP